MVITGPDLAEKLRDIVMTARERLLTIDNTRAAQYPAMNKWSPKEIIGHLIDSASNNHQRFVRPQLKDDLVFSVYPQNDWVRLQNYQQRKWEELVLFWSAYNFHLAAVIANISVDKLNERRTKHNLHEIAWKTVPATQPTSLAYFIGDYIDHLEHHLRQIFA